MTISLVCRQVLQLSAIPGFGLKSFHQLYDHFGSVAEIVSFLHESGSSAACSARFEKLRSAIPNDWERSISDYLLRVEKWLSANESRKIISLEDDDYPALLKEIYCPPPLIYTEGDLASLGCPTMAIVGSRKPSLHGGRNAKQFASFLAKAGFTVVSGLALGIDGQAHRAALRAEGQTCAVLATGLDLVYPNQHRELAEEISANGVLVSEMKLGTQPRPGYFPRRNRIVSGLSLGVLVVEAGLKSGSLITARCALEQNREVFAIPGNIDNLIAQGCNALIKEGARLVDCPEEIIQDLSMPLKVFASGSSESDLKQLSEQERRLIGLFEQPFLTTDEILGSGLGGVALLLETLTSLELKGWLAQVPGGYERVKPVNSALQ